MRTRKNRIFIFQKIKTILKIISISVIILLIGCATSPIDLQNIASIPEHESIVFGSVEIKDETNKIIGGMGGCRIILIPKGSTSGFSYGMQNDGSFYWHLPKGCNSTIASYECPSKLKKFTFSDQSVIGGRIFANFAVPREKDAVYVGKITVILLSETLAYRNVIEDDFDIAVKNFKIKYPKFKGDIVKSLMELEKPR